MPYFPTSQPPPTPSEQFKQLLESYNIGGMYKVLSIWIERLYHIKL